MAFVPYFLHSANQTTRNARVRDGDNDYIGPDGTYYWSDDDGETLYGPDGAMFWSDGDGGYIQY